MHWPTRSRSDGIALTGGTLIGKTRIGMQGRQERIAQTLRNAKFSKGPQPTVSCIQLVQILLYALLLPYDGRQRQALSLSPTNSNNYDVPFAPLARFFYLRFREIRRNPYVV
ncbi:hypothetical protein [Xanthomonas sp. 3075]|uniref:hypothetical protein n=1 Tax=Xanthomonas sp. 3075 TaxID=3035315 RepID=UPI001622B48E|nr:hypothetical protein [Xanthomonas sp. 3075]